MLRRARVPHGKASEILPVLESRLTDKALRCYLASYFGCRLGDSIASAGVSLNVPIAAPFQEARTAILEQNADRVVAEVGEAEFNMVPGGKLDPTQADGKSELIYKSRYTLVRDARGVSRNLRPRALVQGVGVPEEVAARGRGPATFRSAGGTR